MCYTYPDVETTALTGNHILTGLEQGTDDSGGMWWLNDGSTYILFELDGQPYQMVGGGRSWIGKKMGFEALWEVDNGRRPETIFEPVKVNVAATKKSLTVTRADTGDLIFRAAETSPTTFHVESKPEVAQFRLPEEETLSPPHSSAERELAASSS